MDDILNKPLAEITEDPFFRADNFKNEPWYDDFQMYLHIGVCQPKPEHALQVQKALKVMGYPTHTAEHDGKLYLAPGEIGNRQQKKETRQGALKLWGRIQESMAGLPAIP